MNETKATHIFAATGIGPAGKLATAMFLSLSIAGATYGQYGPAGPCENCNRVAAAGIGPDAYAYSKVVPFTHCPLVKCSCWEPMATCGWSMGHSARYRPLACR